MGKYIDADHLRAEIEKIYKSEIQPWLSGVSPKSVIYEYVLPLIDSLQQEQQEVDLEKPTNMELEDEIDKSINSLDGCFTKINGLPEYHLVTDEELRKFARHFAEWQKKQDEEEQADLFTIVALDAAQRAKEQMMKEAVQMYRCYDEEHNLVGFSVDYDAPGAYGNLVSIIVKEDSYD